MKTKTKVTALAGAVLALLVGSAALLFSESSGASASRGALATSIDTTPQSTKTHQGESGRSPVRLSPESGCGSSLGSDRSTLASALAAVSSSTTSGARASDTTSMPKIHEARANDAEAKSEKLREVLGRVDWRRTVRDLLASSARGRATRLPPEVAVEVARLNLALAEAASVLGVSPPRAALADPEVRAVVVPAWLDALGADLTKEQADSVRRLVETPDPDAGPAPDNFLEDCDRRVAARIDFEEKLAQVLAPEQVAAYASHVGDDPLFGPPVPRVAIAAATPDELLARVAAAWRINYGIAAGASPAIDGAAARFVEAALAVPEAPADLDPVATRRAQLGRTARLLELQVAAEKTLAADPSLTREERSRVARGSPVAFDLALAR